MGEQPKSIWSTIILVISLLSFLCLLTISAYLGWQTVQQVGSNAEVSLALTETQTGFETAEVHADATATQLAEIIETEEAQLTAESVTATAQAETDLTATVAAGDIVNLMEALYWEGEQDYFKALLDTGIGDSDPDESIRTGVLHYINPDYVETDCTDRGYYNQVVSVVIDNPESPTSGSWSYGLMIRDKSDGNTRLVFSSFGWLDYHLYSEEMEDTINDIFFDWTLTLNYGKEDSNNITVVMIENRAFVMVNGYYAAAIEDPFADDDDGQTCVGIGFYPDTTRPGSYTHYSDFKVWQLPRLDVKDEAG